MKDVGAACNESVFTTSSFPEIFLITGMIVKHPKHETMDLENSEYLTNTTYTLSPCEVPKDATRTLFLFHAFKIDFNTTTMNACGRTRCMSGLVLVLTIALRMVTIVLGFSSLPSHSLTRSSATGLQAAAKTNFPAMTRDEVQAMLDTIPVYAVTEPNQEGLVLLKEKNNPKDIAYFFFSPDAALTVFSPLRKKENESNRIGEWSVSAYPLGLVWFELINEPEEGIEYRLLPEPEDLIGAQNLLKEQQKQMKQNNPKTNELFKASFNQIPIFVDQFLRVTAAAPSDGADDDNRERVPMYFSLKDLMGTVNQAIKSSSGEYQAAMSAIDLSDLIEEMMKDNANDYRRAIFVPPTPETNKAAKSSSSTPSSSPASTANQPVGDDLQWQGKNPLGMRDTGPISTPTASDDLWD